MEMMVVMVIPTAVVAALVAPQVVVGREVKVGPALSL
jgi:hypothetical protein